MSALQPSGEIKFGEEQLTSRDKILRIGDGISVSGSGQIPNFDWKFTICSLLVLGCVAVRIVAIYSLHSALKSKNSDGGWL